MKDFEPFDQYSAYDHSKSTVPSSTSANTNEVQGVARYFPPRLTKREHFAAMVLQGIMSREWSDMDLACEQAVNAADKLIKKLNQ